MLITPSLFTPHLLLPSPVTLFLLPFPFATFFSLFPSLPSLCLQSPTFLSLHFLSVLFSIITLPDFPRFSFSSTLSFTFPSRPVPSLTYPSRPVPPRLFPSSFLSLSRLLFLRSIQLPTFISLRGRRRRGGKGENDCAK